MQSSFGFYLFSASAVAGMSAGFAARRLYNSSISPNRGWWAIMLFVATVATLLLISAAARAADLISIQRQCAAAVEQANGCTTACVNRLWKEVARCTNERSGHRFPLDKLEKCMRQVDSRRIAARTPELVGNPVAEAFTCAEG